MCKGEPVFIPRYYEDLDVLHVGCEPPRSYFIPASHPTDTRFAAREQSDRFQLLNGEWSFRYYASIYELDDAVRASQSQHEPVFFEPMFNPDESFTLLNVPSVWQMNGYDHNQYTNTRYPSRSTRRTCRQIIHVRCIARCSTTRRIPQRRAHT